MTPQNDSEQLTDRQENEIEILETVKKWESIAHDAHEKGIITQEERDEYIRIENKIWDGTIKRVKEGE